MRFLNNTLLFSCCMAVSLSTSAMEAQFSNLAPMGLHSESIDATNPVVVATVTYQTTSGNLTASARDLFGTDVYPVTLLSSITSTETSAIGPGSIHTYEIDISASCDPNDPATLLEFTVLDTFFSVGTVITRWLNCD